MNRGDLLEIRRGLIDADHKASDAAFKRGIGEIEERMLSVRSYSESLVEFYTEALSNAALTRKPGAWRMLVSLYTDKNKLTSEAVRVLVDAIVDSYGGYEDERLCLTASDFVARVPPPDSAIAALKRMSSTSHSSGIVGVQVGLQAIAANIPPGDARLKAIKDLHAAGEQRLSDLARH